MTWKIRELRAANEALSERVRQLSEENLRQRTKNVELYAEVRKLRAWWRALKSIGNGQ